MSPVDTVTEGVMAIKGGATVAVTGGLWAWMADNGSVIGPACAIVGALCAAGGLALNFYRTFRDKQDDK